ncbi:MAG: hypothetical protein SNJ64_04315 [Endomicrobiia bacterium]
MKTYEITIKPKSGFGTPLKGDTIFGQICWQIVSDEKLFGKTLDNLLKNYDKKPFMVVSSAYPKNQQSYILKKPEIPLHLLLNFDSFNKKEVIKKRKELKNKRWMSVSKDNPILSLKEMKYFSYEYIKEQLQPHNKINRITNKTGNENFAPFSVSQEVYDSTRELSIFVGLDETELSIEQVKEAFDRIGKYGFGKDASTGLGRFDVLNISEINLSELGSENPNACYTLSPCVPEKNTYSKIYFSPFIRFGKHGDVLAKSKNPFKNPIIMACEGAVFVPNNEEIFNKPYIGTAVYNISKSEPKTVAQGYSLYIPIKLEL